MKLVNEMIALCNWFVLSIILTSVLGVFGEQIFEETPVTQEVSSGQNVKLSCKVYNKRGQCSWQKNRKPVGMYRDKYEWAGIHDGDCSILIKNASLEFDDGFWECQVTAGDFTLQDALTSPAAQLIVRVNPKNPSLLNGNYSLNTTLTLTEGREVIISCSSRYGNPPALIKWYIGENEVKPLKAQTNATEENNPKTWKALSVLKVRGQRENHGLPIRCLAVHPANPASAFAESLLNVHYAPEVKIETSPRMLPSALEDSGSVMSLKCIADSNPVASIEWFKDSTPISTTNSGKLLTSTSKIFQNNTLIVSELRFEPVTRSDAGLYSCRAVNIVNEGSSAKYRIDVQYPPRMKINKQNVNLNPPEETASLSTAIEPFECAEYDGNPSPHYRWEHMQSGTWKMIINQDKNKENGRKLKLENIMWSDEGEYRCFAYNFINGDRRETQSEQRFTLNVMGPPEIQTKSSSDDNGFFESIGWVGEPAHRLKSRFCSRPRPQLVAWEWGSLRLIAGQSYNSKFAALPLEPIVESNSTSNCYWAILEIRNVQKEDARTYSLHVESEKGKDSTSLRLLVRNPTETQMFTIVAVLGSLILLLLVCIGVFCWCRSKRKRYRAEDEEEEGSIAADAFYNTTLSTDHHSKPHHDSNQNRNNNFTRKPINDSGLSVMYDYDQINKQTETMSPEALKLRRAPAVLQAPTIV